ncbi:MAG: hypothetical protein HQ402_01255 [Parcubacteria group bacterium]|nr:hypothetical protein [Parcubacteria group bacterium]
MNNENIEKKPIGPAVGVIIILALIVIGSIYFWNQRVVENKNMQATTTPEALIEQLKDQSNSDELNSIEADLNATDLSGLDTEKTMIEAGLKESAQ